MLDNFRICGETILCDHPYSFDEPNRQFPVIKAIFNHILYGENSFALYAVLENLTKKSFSITDIAIVRYGPHRPILTSKVKEATSQSQKHIFIFDDKRIYETDICLPKDIFKRRIKLAPGKAVAGWMEFSTLSLDCLHFANMSMKADKRKRWLTTHIGNYSLYFRSIDVSLCKI